MARSTKTFRIFVSSTFSDLKAERNALQQRVFPRLKALCQARGCRFQAIDLRWGVRDEAGLDQQTLRICLEEIDRCRRVTPRPNFIVLLGDRYGWRPAPPEIPADEFDLLKAAVDSAADIALFELWYRRDDNAVPPKYCLQPRTGEFVDSERWDVVERGLRTVLSTAAAAAGVDPEARQKYEFSATEQEIVRGALSIPDAADHVFAFIRSIKGLPLDLSARDFRDLGHAGEPNIDAAECLERLKQQIHGRLPGHVYEYEADWKGDGPSSDHLDRLCGDVFRSLAPLIEAEAQHTAGSAEENERQFHRSFAAERARIFIGREAPLQTIKDFLSVPNPLPLVIWGDEGSGKSALMAAAAEHAGRELAGAEVVARFIGVTPGASDGRTLLSGLCREIVLRLAIPEAEARIPDEYAQLYAKFRSLIGFATPQRPLVIFLDACDQLRENDPALDFAWLPRALPQHVHIIISSLPGRSLDALNARVPEENRFELGRLTANEGGRILDAWLSDANRTLQLEQRRAVLEPFAECGSPLYLKLAFEEVRRWRSFSIPLRFPSTTDGTLRQMLRRLESDHGALLVSRSMGYLAASRFGLTEDELLDMLALDEPFFQDFLEHAHHDLPEDEPTIRQIPIAVWSRLFHDMEPYLTERSADEMTLLTFYHNSVAREVTNRYLIGDDRLLSHRHLAVYFGGTAPNVEQPLLLNEGKPNRRRLTEQPYQELRGELWNELEATIGEVDFLWTKRSADGYFSVLRLLIELLEDMPPGCPAWEPVSAVLQVLERTANHFREDVDRLEHQPYLLFRAWEAKQYEDRSARGAPDSSSLMMGRRDATFLVQQMHNGLVGNWADSILGNKLLEASARKHGVWLKRKVWSVGPGSPSFQRRLIHPGRVRAVAFLPNGEQIASCDDTGRAYLWDLDTGDCLRILEGFPWYCIYSVAVSPDGALMACDGGERVHATSKPYMHNGVRVAREPGVRLWDLATGDCITVLDAGEPGPCVVAFSPTKEILAGGCADGIVRLWSVPDGECVQWLEGGSAEALSIAFSPAGDRLVLGLADGAIRVWNLNSGDLLRERNEPYGAAGPIAFWPDIDTVALASRDGLSLWDMNKGESRVFADISVEAASLPEWLPQDPDIEADDLMPPRRAKPGEYAGTFAQSRDGSTIAIAGKDRTVRLRRASDGSESGILLGAWRHSLLAFSPDGEKLAGFGRNSDSLVIWDCSDAISSLPRERHDAEIMAAAFSADGRHAVTGARDGSICYWEVDTGSCVRTLEGHTDAVLSVDWSGDGERIASASADKSIRLWDTGSGVCERVINTDPGWHPRAAVSPDGAFLAATGRKNLIHVWSADDGALLHSLERHINNPNCILFSPDGRILTSSSSEKTVLWDPITGQVQRELGEVRWNYVNAVFAGGGGRFVMVDTGTVRVWNTDLWDFHDVRVGGIADNPFLPLALSPSGSALAFATDRSVELLDLDNGTILASIPAETYVLSIWFAPDRPEIRVLDNGGATGVPGIGVYEIMNSPILL